MLKLDKYFSKNKINIMKISSGTVLGQAVSVITLPVIARLYAPSILGEFASVNAVITICASYLDLGLTNAIMIEKDEDTYDLYRVISTLTLLLTVISTACAGMYLSTVMTVGISKLVWIILYFAVNLFVSQQIQLSYTWLNRNQEYSCLMKNQVIKSIVFGITAIGLGLCGSGESGYFLGYTLSQIATLMHMRRLLPSGLLIFNVELSVKFFKKHRHFLIYQLPFNLIGNFKDQLPTLLIGRFWGDSMLGYYSMAQKILSIPVGILSNAIGKVFYSIASEMRRKGEGIGSYVQKNITRAMLLAILPVAVIMACSDTLIPLVLGNEWMDASGFIVILAFQAYIVFLQGSVQGLSIILEKQSYSLVSVIAQIAAVFAAVLLGNYWFTSIYVALLLMVLLFSIITTIYFSFMYGVMDLSRYQYPVTIFFSMVGIVLLYWGLHGILNVL